MGYYICLVDKEDSRCGRILSKRRKTQLTTTHWRATAGVNSSRFLIVLAPPAPLFAQPVARRDGKSIAQCWSSLVKKDEYPKGNVVHA
jgi:hypothetical protein